MATVHRFGRFELDEDLRELRLDGREVALQPRLYAVLLHLVRNGDRVVDKTELLEKVWVDEIVSEGSLQRAMSLIRSALRAGGADTAIRTYPRQGYRFCAELASAPDRRSAERWQSPAATGSLAEAREAYAAGDWRTACTAYASAHDATALGADDLEAWGYAAHWAGELADAVGPLERAVGAHTAGGDRIAAARSALALSLICFERLELVLANGWHERAQSLLEGGPPCREHGMIAWLRCRLALADGNLEEALDAAEATRRHGAELSDLDLEALGLAYAGLVTLALGSVRAGIALQNDAAALALSGVVSPHVAGIVYCGVIFGFCNRGDWEAASQWTTRFSRLCSHHAIASFPGLCRLHRAEILVTRGELMQATEELSTARRLLATSATWAEGDAHRLTGDIALARGDLEGADRAYRRAHELGWDPQPGYSRLQLERGRPHAAVRSLERVLDGGNWASRQRRSFLLATLVEIAVAAGDIERAHEALTELDGDPAFASTKALDAARGAARAAVHAAEGERREAIRCLRESIRLWTESGSAFPVAHARLRLAELYEAEGDAEAAGLELDSAESAFERVGAPVWVERCRSRRRALQDPG